MTITEYLQQWLVLSGLEEADFEIEEETQEGRLLFNLIIPEEKAGFYIRTDLLKSHNTRRRGRKIEIGLGKA